MNVSPSAPTLNTAHGAHGKSGASGNPLADFMALLSQLGISIGEDGTPIVGEGDALKKTTLVSPVLGETRPGKGAQDAAAKLLAKLTGKSGKTSTGGDAGDSVDASATTQGDPAANLAALLAQVDQSGNKSLDKLDIASLLTAARAIASGETVKTDGDAAPLVAPPAAKPAPGIASLLARTKSDNSPSAPTPGEVQSAFAQLENLVSRASSDPKVSAKTEKQAANDDSAAETANPAGQDISTTKLTELLARLTAATKPGAAQAQPQPQLPAQAVANAARPHVDPQLAAIAEAVQRPLKENKPDSDQPATLAVTSLSTPTATAPAATDGPNMPSTDDTMRHHLDLARDTQWLDTLARDIARAAQSDTQLRFQLNPEHLGSLKVEVLNGVNGTSVKLTADTEAARAILADAQPRLVAEARAQGLRISEAQVNLSGQGGGGQRQMTETPVIVRTGNAAGTVAEVAQDMPAGSGERYA